MYKKDQYYRGGHCKFNLTIHIVFAIKYRKPIIVNQVEQDIKNIFLDIAKENDWIIQAIETDRDHIHILLDYKPYENVSSIIKKLKQYSTYRIWQLHQELKQYFWKRNVFWSEGYFVCSIGNASNDTIKKYIESQG